MFNTHLPKLLNEIPNLLNPIISNFQIEYTHYTIPQLLLIYFHLQYFTKHIIDIQIYYTNHPYIYYSYNIKFILSTPIQIGLYMYHTLKHSTVQCPHYNIILSPLYFNDLKFSCLLGHLINIYFDCTYIPASEQKKNFIINFTFFF